MLTRRNLLLLSSAFAVTACSGGLPKLEQANPPQPTLATVTLAISGMT